MKRKQKKSSTEHDWVPVVVVTQGEQKICSRSTLYRLINAKVIKSASMRTPGHVRGRRLVYLPSLVAYLEGLANEECSRTELGGEERSGKAQERAFDGCEIDFSQGTSNEGVTSISLGSSLIAQFGAQASITLGNKEEKNTHSREKGGSNA